MAIKDKWVEFVGLTGYIDAGSGYKAYYIDKLITVEAWIWISSVMGSGEKGLITNYDNNRGFGLMLDNRKLAFYVNEYKATSNTVLANDTWHHVAATYDGSRPRLYVNGVEQPISTAMPSGLTMTYATNPTLYIGRTLGQSGSADFYGRVCEVRLWDVARTATELAANSEKSLDASITPLKARWALDDGSTTVANDMINAKEASLRGNVIPGSSANTGSVNPAQIQPLQRPKAHVDTSAVLGAALDKLNRKSVMGLLKQLTAQLQTQASTISTHTTDIGTNKDAVKKAADDLKKHLDTHDANVKTIVSNEISGLLQESVFKEAADKLALLQKQVDIVRASALSLDAGELASVKEALESVLKDDVLGPYVINSFIRVDGQNVRLFSFLDRLARRIEVVGTEFIFNDNHIEEARFSTSDMQHIIFKAEAEVWDTEIYYTFRTEHPYWEQLTFQVRVRKVTSSETINGVTLQFDEYQPVYHSNLYYDMNLFY